MYGYWSYDSRQIVFASCQKYHAFGIFKEVLSLLGDEGQLLGTQCDDLYAVSLTLNQCCRIFPYCWRNLTSDGSSPWSSTWTWMWGSCPFSSVEITMCRETSGTLARSKLMIPIGPYWQRNAQVWKGISPLASSSCTTQVAWLHQSSALSSWACRGIHLSSWDQQNGIRLMWEIEDCTYSHTFTRINLSLQRIVFVTRTINA